MKPLTERQQEVLDIIERSLDEQGRPPTRQEISRELGVSSANTAEMHLRALAKKGYLELLADNHRNIRLLMPSNKVDHRLPLIGRVAAGSPILAVENVEGHYHCPELFQPKADYLLRVDGMSMRDSGIEDDDLLAVHRTSDARNKQIVVARLDDEVTVKRLSKKGSRITLLPENPDFEPIPVDPTQTFAIEGIAVGVIRSVH